MSRFIKFPLKAPLRPYKGKALSAFSTQAAPDALPLLKPVVPGAVNEPTYPQFIVDNSKGQLSEPYFIQVPWNDLYEGPFDTDPGDSIQLLLDGLPYGDPYTITQDDVDASESGEESFLSIPFPLGANDPFQDDHRPYSLGYEARYFLSGRSDRSFNTTIYIDRIAPGGELNGQVILPAVGDDRVVSLAQLDDQNRLVGRVPSYSGEWQGDTITLFIFANGLYIDLPGFIQLPPGPVPGVVTVYYPMDELIKAGDGVRLLGYRVTDLAGNVSVYSEGTPVVLLLDNVPQPGDLLAPVVPLFSNDGIIDEADARHLEVWIPKFPHAVPSGDTIRLLWGDDSAGLGSFADAEADPIKIFTVGYGTIRDYADSPYRVDVRYQVLRSGVVIGTSPVFQVLVDTRLPGGPDPDPNTPEHGNLGLPFARGAGGGDLNVITTEQYGQDAQLTVPWPTPTGDLTVTFLVDDQVTVRWGGITLPTPPYRITAADVATKLPLVFILTGEQMESEGSGRVPLSYQVARRFPAAGGIPEHTNTAYSETQIVQVIGKDELPGGGAELAAGNWVILNENGALTLPNTRGGARFRVNLTYLNVALGDKLELYFQGYRGTGNVVLPGTDYYGDHFVGPSDLNNTWFDFLVPESIFTTELFTGNVNNVKVYYTATNPAGTGTSATRATRIDLRGTSPLAGVASFSGTSTGVLGVSGNSSGMSQLISSPYRSPSAVKPDRNAATLAAFIAQLNSKTLTPGK